MKGRYCAPMEHHRHRSFSTAAPGLRNTRLEVFTKLSFGMLPSTRNCGVRSASAPKPAEHQAGVHKIRCPWSFDERNETARRCAARALRPTSNERHRLANGSRPVIGPSKLGGFSEMASKPVGAIVERILVATCKQRIATNPEPRKSRGDLSRSECGADFGER